MKILRTKIVLLLPIILYFYWKKDLDTFTPVAAILFGAQEVCDLWRNLFSQWNSDVLMYVIEKCLAVSPLDEIVEQNKWNNSCSDD